MMTAIVYLVETRSCFNQILIVTHSLVLFWYCKEDGD